MVSHDIVSAVRYASHILHIRSGSAFLGKTADYVNSSLGKAFLGGEEDA
jgi:zinc transport system ATP-binding protein